MDIPKKTVSYKKISRRYLIVIPMLIVLISVLYMCFTTLTRHLYVQNTLEDFRRESERTAYEVELHIENKINTLMAFSGLLGEENDLNSIYNLNRLKAINNNLNLYMLGIIDKDKAQFINTENEAYSVLGYGWFDRLRKGSIIRGENFDFSDELYTLYAVPVYRGSRITGGVGCIDKVSEFSEVFVHSDKFDYEIINENGVVIAESSNMLGIGKNINDFFTKENVEKYKRVVSEGEEILTEQAIDDQACRIQMVPLEFNDYVLLSILTDKDYNSELYRDFGLMLAQYLIFIIIISAVIISAILFFNLSNRSIISQLNRFTAAGNMLKTAYILHSPERPFTIKYRSASSGSVKGADFKQGDNLEDIIYSEDKSRTIKAIEDFASSNETEKRIYFRISSKEDGPHWVCSNIAKDRKSGLLVSIISAVDRFAKVSEEVQLMTKRLNQLSYVSSYYIFELDVNKKRLFMSENLRERLGYSIEAADCFKESVRTSLISPLSIKDLNRLIESCKRGKRSLEGELDIKTAAGTYVTFHIQAEVMGTVIKDEIKVLAILNEVKKE